MTSEEKAGQVLLPFFKGMAVEAQAATIERLHLAGSIIMGDNVPLDAHGRMDVEGMAALNQRLAQAAAANGRPWPGIIAVDQEGGQVARLGPPLTEWPTPMSYGAAGSGPLAREAGQGLAAELVPLGFNVDFAPDTDVTSGPKDVTIGARSLSSDPGAAAALGVSFSEGMLTAGVLPTVKHFPGHGSMTVDSHLSLPTQTATVAELSARDWKPFQAAATAGLPMVMTGHIAVPALEPGVPASLSAPTYDALRALGFKGVAVTDALNMGAVTKQYPGGTAAVMALAAGADLLLMPADVDQAHAAIVHAVATGGLPPERLDEAARRVATMMVWHARTASKTGAPAGSSAPLSARVSASAVTVLSGPCGGPMVPGAVQVAGGNPADRARFEAAAARAGLSLGSGPVVSLIGYGGRGAGGDIAVALDAPWPLQESTAPVKMALYGRSDGAFDALAAVLAGKAAAPGKLPAAVGSFPAGTGCP
ncbi:glycoside hydrolase family 3 N-terminal domain-containing protein [Pseudarthrobacter sp. NamE5]|uniref:glycoside hydrolase family 3 N-terminal domain-containing protein n=1 Tax=Pseudarthrobacter sp. NamE5 TaxID=2576839 RepID=UPI00110A45DD|nr:glycoside hydrolase family 3 N-terminal domain-containing protein [Pseudarthrobacter sp. NamE5]TLM86940.1 beta-N-acetylhexosaminidase [Pseudarthrobacter sp. NamE5]